MRTTLIRTAAVAFALSAAAAPAAVAQEGGGSWTPSHVTTPDDRTVPVAPGTFPRPDVSQRTDPVETDGGIDWGDAGIGGGVVGAIALLASGGVLVARRRSTAAA